MLPAALVRARNSFWLRACDQVGRQPHLHGRPTIEDFGGRIRLGDRFRLASRPVPSHLVAGPGALLEIGRDVSIGHGAAIAAFDRVQIGQGTRIGAFVIIMDTNFHTAGDQSVQHDCRPVVIGDRCRIGTRVTITRGVSIGDGAEILAGSVVTTAIPAGVCAGGARARIIGAAGDPAARWDSAAAVIPELLMEAFDLEAPPEPGVALQSVRGWNGGTLRLVSAIHNRLGVNLDPAVIHKARHSADLADIAARAQREQRRT
jgi:acetyltransferase-like isoleucine patch superfamily enzyme